MTEHVIAFPLRHARPDRRIRLAIGRHPSSRMTSFLAGVACGIAIGVPASVVTGVGIFAQEFMLLVAVLPLLTLSAARDRAREVQRSRRRRVPRQSGVSVRRAA